MWLVPKPPQGESPWGRRHKLSLPRWLWHYRMRHDLLVEFLQRLPSCGAQGFDKLLDEMREENKLECGGLNIEDGRLDTDCKQWFQPNRSVRAYNNYSITSHQSTNVPKKNAYITAHDKVSSHLKMQAFKKDELLGHALAEDLRRFIDNSEFGDELGNQEADTMFEPLKFRKPFTKKIQAITGEIYHQETTLKYRACHRVVVLETQEYPHDPRPKLREYLYLISILHETITAQGSFGSKAPRIKRQRHAYTHQAAPLLMISVYHGGSARIITGYVGNKIQINFSEVIKFTRENFRSKMWKLLTWSKPHCLGDTTLLDPELFDPRLKPIDDSDESDDSIVRTEKHRFGVADQKAVGRFGVRRDGYYNVTAITKD